MQQLSTSCLQGPTAMLSSGWTSQLSAAMISGGGTSRHRERRGAGRGRTASGPGAAAAKASWPSGTPDLFGWISNEWYGATDSVNMQNSLNLYYPSWLIFHSCTCQDRDNPVNEIWSISSLTDTYSKQFKYVSGSEGEYKAQPQDVLVFPFFSLVFSF